MFTNLLSILCQAVIVEKVDRRSQALLTTLCFPHRAFFSFSLSFRWLGYGLFLESEADGLEFMIHQKIRPLGCILCFIFVITYLSLRAHFREIRHGEIFLFFK